MTTREVVLDGGSPWGFRLHGGADVHQPLRISRVNPGSKAALRGIREGDFITSINNQSTKDISNAEAHALLRNSGDTLKLGLNEDGGSPKRRQYRTVHQETHSETVRRSSTTSYTTVTSSKTIDTSNELASKVNGSTRNLNGEPPNTPAVPHRSPLSLSSSSSTSTYTSLTSPSGTDMADNARSRRKRGRNRRKAKVNATEVIIEETERCDSPGDKKEYRVESPQRVKSPEGKKPVKSRSLDDDDVKIQELSEVSESEDKSECKAIVSEAESDVEWEVTTTMEDPLVQTGTISTLSLNLDLCTTQEVSLISPEEELTLRNFLEGLNLVNSPEDAFRQINEISTMESVKKRRARKRAAIEQYFSPMVQNPRFLDVISEETSDLSDREQSFTHHLKQGTPEPDVPQSRPKKTRRVVANPTILVGTKIIDVPAVTHEISTSNLPQSTAEVVFLDDSSNSTTPDPKSEDDEKITTDDLLSSAHSSFADIRESETAEEKKQVTFVVKKDDVLVSEGQSVEWNEEKAIGAELTPPPTPDDVSPRNETKCQEDPQIQNRVVNITVERRDAQDKEEMSIDQPRSEEIETTTFKSEVSFSSAPKSSKSTRENEEKTRKAEIKAEEEKQSSSSADHSDFSESSYKSFETERIIPISIENRHNIAQNETTKEKTKRIIPVTVEKEEKKAQEVDHELKEKFLSSPSTNPRSNVERIIPITTEGEKKNTQTSGELGSKKLEETKERIDKFFTSVSETPRPLTSNAEIIIPITIETEEKSTQNKLKIISKKLEETKEKLFEKQSQVPINSADSSRPKTERIILITLENDQKTNLHDKDVASKKVEVTKERADQNFLSSTSEAHINSTVERIIPVTVEREEKIAQNDELMSNKLEETKDKIVDAPSPKDSRSTTERIIPFTVKKDEKTSLYKKLEETKERINQKFLSSKSEAPVEKIITVTKEDITSSKIDKTKEKLAGDNSFSYSDYSKFSENAERIIPVARENKLEEAKERIINIKIEKETETQPNNFAQTVPKKLEDRVINVEVDKDWKPKADAKENPSKEKIVPVRIEEKSSTDTQIFRQSSYEKSEYSSFSHGSSIESAANQVPKEKIINVEVEPRSKKLEEKNVKPTKQDKRIKITKEIRIPVEINVKPKPTLYDYTKKSEGSKETIIHVELEKSPPKSDKFKNEEISETQDTKDCPEIVKLDDMKPPVVVTPSSPNPFSKLLTSEPEYKQFNPADSEKKIEQKNNARQDDQDLKVEHESTLKRFLDEENVQSSLLDQKTEEKESPSKEVESICGVPRPTTLFYSNVLSPPAPSPSPSHSSGSSSRATSLCTVKNSSTADLTSIDEEPTKKEYPLSLREICVNFLATQPFGTDILQELADVSSSIEHLTQNLLTPTPNLPAFMKKSNDSVEIPAMSKDWVGLPTEEDPRVLVCLSPTQKLQLDKSRKMSDEAAKLLDLHEKFIYRTTYHDAVERQVKNEVEITAIKPDVSNRLLAIIRDAQEPKFRKFSTLPLNMDSARLKAKDLSEWLKLARSKSTDDENNQNVGNAQRRNSLPQELYKQQMEYLQEKEREIQRELEILEEEKRNLDMSRKFRPEDYHISKKGDFATRKTRPVSMPVATEFFRQQMYEEYLDQIAAREERKQHKVIKVSMVETSPIIKASTGIEDEFMNKVKQKQELGKLNREDNTDDESDDKVPKHLQEFLDIAKIDADGVWSPGQKQDARPEEVSRSKQGNNEPISPVWTPKSATSSPTVERKEFRPVKFESPVLSRKGYRNDESDSSQEPPWRVPDTSSDTGVVLSSTLEKRLPTSHSSPASGFSDFSTTRLPRVQNPTITLLQKAREGQLPKGALYIEQDQSVKRTKHEKPGFVGPGEILYKIKNEYTSESDSERPRKMADLGPRKFEGIGPTTRDGMPMILRSEVKDANQSKWYKKMYDTIHKQRPHRDEFVTVRYKQKRGQYPYTSGYLSEPEPGAYDSDFTDYKYATLDRRRIRDNEMSSTMPRNAPDKVGASVIKHGHDPYKNQPGRIENYIPGHSSISEKEAKEWWDEVMDIFDGHLEQQKRVPQTKSFINQALKESGYESDSTLVFRRRDDTAQLLSPTEQKEAYKAIQKGGDVPLYGLRKPAPERPKDANGEEFPEEPEVEFFPISPTLTRIRVHKTVKPQKEILCYPVTVHPHPSTVFAHYKRTAPSAVTPKPPSPPRRRSSRNNSTLRLISTMKVKSEKSPICRRHETCFTTTSNVDNTKVKYLRDKITCKLSPARGKDTKPKIRVSKVVTASPELRSRIVSTLTTSKDAKTRIQSRTNIKNICCRAGAKKCKKCASRAETKIAPPQTKTFGTEKRKVDLTLPKIRRTTIVSSPDLLSPTEVKKAVETQSRTLPSGAVFKRTTAVLTNSKDAVLPIKVGITDKGKSLLRSTIYKPPSPSLKLRAKSLSPVLSEKPQHKISLESLRSPLGTKRVISTTGRAPLTKTSKITKPKTVSSTDLKRVKSTKEQINGDIKKSTKTKDTKCAGRAAGTEIAKKLREMSDEFGSADLTEIQKQKEAIQTDYFFQHLFLRDLPSPTPSMASRSSWLLERAYQLQKRRSSTEPTISAMKVYLSHTRPVSDSKFRSLDLALSRSRSASPRSVTWEVPPVHHVEKRSSSLPPKLVFSQTSRPVSPKVERRFKSPTPPPSPRLIRSPSSRRIMQMKNQIERISEGSESPKNELSIYTCPSICHSTSSIDSYDRKEYQNYVKELLRSSTRSSKFKDLNDFYSAIEKFGRLEQTASSYSLKPRGRFEDEIIDYDRWREVRTRERAEKELKSLITQLKKDAKEKGFVFSPKEVDSYRWKKEYDRGLRIKEKSVDNIKEEFEKLKDEESERENAKRRELASLKDTYKPLWRGDSVLSLANKMVERRSQSEGRVSSARQKIIDSEAMLTHGIGSRIWSSLSSEQVNILKNQLSEIYSQNLPKKETLDYSIQVPEESVYRSPLTVRRNSDSPPKSLSENDKKVLSHSISKEVLERRPVLLAKETRGAIAAAMSKSCPPEFHEEPCKALVKTDATTSKLVSASETESGSTDESTKTVIQVKDEIKKKVEYFETVAEQEKFAPTIYKPAEDFDDASSIQSPTFKRRSITSQSYQNLKEFFGEQELMKFATVPLSATRKEVYVSPQRPQALGSSASEATMNGSISRSRSLSPEPLTVVKSGEVRRLKTQFESPERPYPPRMTFLKPRRCRSDPSLYKYSQICIPGQNHGDVELLRCKYEYPAHAGRGRSRHRRGGVVSPTFLRAEDRFMPHINIISKIANLYAKKHNPEEKSQSMEELANILGCPVGEVEKLRQKFDAYGGNISLLGHMFTSSPNIKELRDIAPYLAASWMAHRYPKSEDNTRSLSSPESSLASRDTSLVRRQRPKSCSPPPKKTILKDEKFDAKNRYQPEPLRYKSWWSSTHTRPSVSFKEPEPPLPPPKGHHDVRHLQQESPRKYVENEVTIHYKTPVRQEIKEYLSEDELAYRQAEAMKKIYQEERRRKYLQVSKSLQELQDLNNRRHTDNFIPSQKSPIPLNRYDDFDDLAPPVKPRPRSPEPRLMARALYNFVGQTARELTFRKGDLIYVRRQVDKNWYEGELNAMVGLFPVNYVEIVTYDTAKATPRKSHEGQARAKYNFVAQTHLELSLAKGELVVVTRRVDDNWFEGKIGGRKGIFPVSYVDILIDPSDPPSPSAKPVAAPAAHSLLLNGSSGGKESMGSHSYTPNLSSNQLTSSYHAKPVQISGSYGSLNRGAKNPVNQTLHIETQAEPIPYRALYKYLPQNDDELELLEGDTVYVLEKCDDGWYVGSSDRTGAFGTFPGNYVEKI